MTSETNREWLAILRRFSTYVWPPDNNNFRVRVSIALALVLISKVVQVYVGPVALQRAVDQMGSHDHSKTALIVLLLAGFVAGRFGSTLFDNLRNVVFERVGQTATAALSIEVFSHLLTLPTRFHLHKRTGAVAKTIERGAKSVDALLYFAVFNIVPTVFELSLVIILFYSRFGPALALGSSALVIIYIWFTRSMTRWRDDLRSRMNDLDTRATAHAVDSLLNFETVRYFRGEARERERYRSAMVAYADATTTNENGLAWLNIGQTLITSLMLCLGVGIVVYGWRRGIYGPGDVVLVTTLLSQLFRPLDTLSMVYRTIRQALVDMKELFVLLDTPAEPADADISQPLSVDRGRICFENVSFSYDAERFALKSVNLEIEAGSTVAIVGPSGAGKSTIARLIFRLYDISSGRITIDGQDISEVSRDSLRERIGIVPQDAGLFNDSVAYNIAYGATNAPIDRIEAAAKDAAIHDFVASLADGYNTVIGERGLRLSGGERQRLAIARVLLMSPRILILDEATSALDSRTEADIHHALLRLACGRTTIIIAHRLSTIAHADEIVVLENGRIAERGNHIHLIKRDGVYADMWQRQHHAETDPGSKLLQAQS